MDSETRRILMEMKEDIGSIKTDINNIKKQNDEIEKQGDKINELEKIVALHTSHFKFLWWSVVGIVSFLFVDIIAPFVVEWLSK
ncbi:hypothetical protein [Liquorilactobacillus mali]|nr:hypothetical protein [Liquorilactobacillus mali]MDN7145255.1 hypothetical protein [Liquorilactobacillus mali]MDV7758267.1 hypothetical protein [Liquorilactobacillus mali]QFQ74585.1 hypothetical protein LM596_05400 [Liquorilactobacillus mali]